MFLNTRQPEERTRLLKKEALIGRIQGDEFIVDEDIFCPNVFERYVQRPDNLEELSLYEFASHWEVDYKRSKADERESDDEQSEKDEAPFKV